MKIEILGDFLYFILFLFFANLHNLYQIIPILAQETLLNFKNILEQEFLTVNPRFKARIHSTKKILVGTYSLLPLKGVLSRLLELRWPRIGVWPEVLHGRSKTGFWNTTRISCSEMGSLTVWPSGEARFEAGTKAEFTKTSINAGSTGWRGVVLSQICLEKKKKLEGITSLKILFKKMTYSDVNL